jgi:hypothetical protein
MGGNSDEGVTEARRALSYIGGKAGSNIEGDE